MKPALRQIYLDFISIVEQYLSRDLMSLNEAQERMQALMLIEEIQDMLDLVN